MCTKQSDTNRKSCVFTVTLVYITRAISTLPNNSVLRPERRVVTTVNIRRLRDWPYYFPKYSDKYNQNLFSNSKNISLKQVIRCCVSLSLAVLRVTERSTSVHQQFLASRRVPLRDDFMAFVTARLLIAAFVISRGS